MRSTYEVIVGNIGTVYCNHRRSQADAAFMTYKRQSVTQRGRAAGESVTMLKDGEIIREHVGDDREADHGR